MPELVHARHAGGNGAKGGGNAGLFAEHIGAKAPALGGDVCEVDVVALAQHFHLRLCHHFGDVALEFGIA
jgi:hypothetical protein